MHSPPTSNIIVTTNGSHSPDRFPQVLKNARRVAWFESLCRKRSELCAQREDAEQRRAALEAELEEGAAPPEIHLRRKRTQGVILAAIDVSMMLGMMLLIAISLEVFLPKNEFPTWSRWVIAMVLTCAIVMPFHFAFNYEDGDR